MQPYSYKIGVGKGGKGPQEKKKEGCLSIFFSAQKAADRKKQH